LSAVKRIDIGWRYAITEATCPSPGLPARVPCHGMDEPEDLFLHATHAGLFQMEWNLVCASCGNTARSFRGLAKVDPHFVCEMCQMVNEPSLDEYIQVVFTVAPEIRPISYHEPVLDAFNRTSSSDLILKMGLHRGHAIAVTSNDTVDYFRHGLERTTIALAGSPDELGVHARSPCRRRSFRRVQR